MNILIPHSWLLEHLETSASPEEIQRLLSLSGPSVERIHEIEGEPVYDIEVTTNRVDSMSVRGIAREAAVILTQAGIASTLKPIHFADLRPQTSELKPLPEIVNDPSLCKRVIFQVVGNIQKTPSPDWMQKRLRQIGVNVHDAVIDITNYVTHDLGHPCHAFDYDKVMALGGKIIIKQAEAGKKFKIIDGTEFTTVGGEIVFENEQGEIIDLPAIKGTQNTSMADDTKNVLFWLETLDPKKVRFASMTHAIRTVAAQLSEKNVDPHLAEDVLHKGVELVTQLAGGEVVTNVYDEFPGKKPLHSIEVHSSIIQRYLGIELEKEKVKAILENLGCTIEEQNSVNSSEFSTLSYTLFITPPTFRPDLEIPADIVEEVARIYGYHNLPSTLMTGAIPTQKSADNFDMEYTVKELWSALGAYEVYTYSLIDEAQATKESQFVLSSAHDVAKTHVKIKNPLTDDMVYLRRTLWSQHLSVLEKNPQHKELIVFEFANVYLPTEFAREIDWQYRSASKSKDKDSKNLPFEEFHLTLTTNGDTRYAKAMVETMLNKMHFPKLKYIPTQNMSEVSLQVGNITIGTMLSIQAHDQSMVTIFDLDWKNIIQHMRLYPSVTPEKKFTPIVEDLTFTIPSDQHIQRVMESVQQIDLVESVKLKDVYQQNVTFSIQLYSEEKQLSGEEATTIRTEIIKVVTEKHQAHLVGQL